MTEILRDLCRDRIGRQQVVHHAGGDGAAHHAVVLGIRLRQRQPAVLLDRAQPLGAIATGAGEDDAGSIFALVVCERDQETVHRHAGDGRVRQRTQPQPPVFDRQCRVGRDDIDGVGFHHHAVLDRAHREPGRARQHLGQNALVLRVEVLDHHERHAAVRLDRRKQPLQRINAAGRGPDAHDRRPVPELRYLRFGLPYVGLLIHWPGSSSVSRQPHCRFARPGAGTSLRISLSLSSYERLRFLAAAPDLRRRRTNPV